MNAQYKAILEGIRDIKARVDDIDSGLEKDRENIQNLTIRLENVETEVKATRQATNRSSETTRNKVAEVVRPAIKAVENMTTATEQAVKGEKVVVIRKESWWEKIWGHFKNDGKKYQAEHKRPTH